MGVLIKNLYFKLENLRSFDVMIKVVRVNDMVKAKSGHSRLRKEIEVLFCQQ
jgi:hypothetical protein